MGVPKRVPSLNTQVEGKCRELGGINAIHRCALHPRLPWRMHDLTGLTVQAPTQKGLLINTAHGQGCQDHMRWGVLGKSVPASIGGGEANAAHVQPEPEVAH